VTCHNCQSICNRFGKHRNGLQRYRCSQCKKTFTEDHAQPLGDMRLSLDKATAILKLLVEGMSIRSVERITQVHRDTIMRLLILAGERCEKLMDAKMRNIHPTYLQCDEIWTFVQKKRRNVRSGDSPDFGDQWVFIAMDEQTKLVPHFEIGKRTKETTIKFLEGLRWRLTENRFQITTDGYHFYRSIQSIFAGQCDFAQLVKLFGDFGQFETPEGRYSPPRITEVISKVIDGRPDPEHISTSFVERSNLTMRMALRRFTRLTNAFSKKVSHLKAACALHFAWYNFCRVHSSLRITPAMQAGIADHIWNLGELLETGI
jgi:transposase-like protein